MKKKTGITKTLALVLTLGLLCSGLTGCGQTQNSGSAAESLMTESTQPAESTEAVFLKSPADTIFKSSVLSLGALLPKRNFNHTYFIIYPVVFQVFFKGL